MKHWNTFIIMVATAIISSGMLIANIDGLVYNVCTSDGPHGINSLLPRNISHTDVSIEILTINPGGSLNIQVSSDKKIKDIVLWAEFRAQKEQHIGAFKPIVGHAYTDGCDGLPNSTITNYEDFTNTSQIIYEWDPPFGTEITLTLPIREKEPHQKHFPGHRHHHHYHHHHHHHHVEGPCRGNNRHHHPKNNKNHHHKHEKNHHSHHHHIINQFTFKGVAFLENEPVKFHVFTLDKPIYIRGKIPSLNASSLLTTPPASPMTSSTSPTTSSTSPVASTNDVGVYVSAFDNVDSATSNLQSNKWNRIGMMTICFLATGILLIS